MEDSPIMIRILAIVEEIRPILALHRGDAEVIGFTDGIVELKLKGSCEGCPMSIMTFGMALKEKLQQQIPEVKNVIWNN